MSRARARLHTSTPSISGIIQSRIASLGAPSLESTFHAAAPSVVTVTS